MPVESVNPIVFPIDTDADTPTSLRSLVLDVKLECRDCPSGETFFAELDPGQPGCLIMDVRAPV